MITEYIFITVFLAVQAALFFAIEHRLAKSQRAITGMINEFTINISEEIREIRRQTERLDKKN